MEDSLIEHKQYFDKHGEDLPEIRNWQWTKPQMNAHSIPTRPQAPESKPNVKDDLKSLSMPELQAKLRSSPDGLSQAEAQKRLTQYGPNEIEEKEPNPYLKFLTYFWGPIP